MVILRWRRISALRAANFFCATFCRGHIFPDANDPEPRVGGERRLVVTGRKGKKGSWATRLE